MKTPLAHWRSSANIKVKDAAAMAGVTPGMWSRWENNRRDVPAERCTDLEQRLGISRYELRPDIFGNDPRDEGGTQ